ncbi:hypothetical protein BKA82DRAFT_4023807 [Pisolithus tinctorius]|nr:hypothetical protein BKA82DRAFT_4023807 [Pisolithus tinctorius]
MKTAETKAEQSEGIGFSLCTTPLHDLSPHIPEGEYRWRVGDNSNRQKTESEGVGTKLIFVLKNSGVQYMLLYRYGGTTEDIRMGNTDHLEKEIVQTLDHAESNTSPTAVGAEMVCKQQTLGGGMHAGHQHVFWRCKEEVIWGVRRVQDEWGCHGVGNTGGATKGDAFASLIMMEELLASNPILWIPTKVWLEFMAGCIRALQLAQISLKELEPPNLGILTGIICHMIWCTSTTAIILDFHVSRVCERLGMFFLLDLDLHRVPHLPEVQDHDDLEVLKLMEGKIPPLDEEEQFPIGSRPMWAKLTRTIQLQPWLIMQDWKWSAQLSGLGPVVGKLFVLFTCQLWIQLDATWLTGPEGKPEPTSLEDVIQSWTLNQTFRTIRACKFKACNAEIAGSGGAGPTAGQPSQRSPWNVFWTKPGYIWEYHQVMKNRTPLEEFEVLDHLGRIFSVLQTLPDATKGSEKSPGKTWQVEGEKVVLVTNPKFYKIEGISTEKEQQQARRRAS